VTTTELPARLRRAREALGWSREKLSEKVQTDDFVIQEIELGRANPSFDLFLRLLDILDVDPSFLLGMVKKKEPGYCIEFLFGDHTFGHANTLTEALGYITKAEAILVQSPLGPARNRADYIEMITVCGEHIHKGLNETTAEFFGRMGKLCAEKEVPV
jgi:transcriptional regulator with XRE-family HTH domain